MLTVNICGHTFFPTLSGQSVVVDLGANIGEFAHQIIERFGCRVISVEPVEENVQRILSHPRLSVIEAAMGSEIGTSQLNLLVGQDATLSNIPIDSSAYERREVSTLTIGALFDRFNLEHVDLLKVDIEGAELLMLESASDSELLKCEQITIEFHDFMWPETVPQIQKIKSRIVNLGYHCISFMLSNGADVLFMRKTLDITAFDKITAQTITKYYRGFRRRLASSLG